MSTYPQQPGYPVPPGYPPQAGGPWPPPRTGMGCGTKVLIALGVFFLLMLVLCCGGAIGVRSYLQHAITTDPDQIAATTEQMTSIEIPAMLKPFGAGTFRFPLVDKVACIGAMYADKNQNSTLGLISVGNLFDEGTQDKIRQTMEDSLRKQTDDRGQGETLLHRKDSEKTLEIRGEKAVFTITTGTGSKSDKPRIQVRGSFQGKTGPVLLLLDADAEQLPQAKVVEMIESIK